MKKYLGATILFSILLQSNISYCAEVNIIDLRNSSYLSVEVEYPLFANLKNALEEETHLNLEDRDESHITIFAPSEWQKLRKQFKQEDYQLLKNVLQKNPSMQIKCVGVGESRGDKTFFAIIDNADLISARTTLAKKYKLDLYYAPHVTIGYTKHDLHIQDGVDKRICIYQNDHFGSILQ